MKKTLLYKWHKHFCDGFVNVNDNLRYGVFDDQDLIHYELNGYAVNTEMYVKMLLPQGCSEKETGNMGTK
jgi:hypothetical protein